MNNGAWATLSNTIASSVRELEAESAYILSKRLQSSVQRACCASAVRLTASRFSSALRIRNLVHSPTLPQTTYLATRALKLFSFSAEICSAAVELPTGEVVPISSPVT